MLISPLNDFTRHLRRMEGIMAVAIAAIAVLVVVGTLLVEYGDASPAGFIAKLERSSASQDEGNVSIDNGTEELKTLVPEAQQVLQNQVDALTNSENGENSAPPEPEPILYAVFEGEADVVPIQYDPNVSPQHIGNRTAKKDVSQALVDSRSVPDTIGWELTDQIENADDTTTYVMTQSYSPLKVKDMQATVVAAYNGKVLSMTGQYAVMKGSLYVREADTETEFEGLGTLENFDDFEKWAYIEDGTVKNAIEKDGHYFDPATGEEILKTVPPAEPTHR